MAVNNSDLRQATDGLLDKLRNDNAFRDVSSDAHH